MAVSSTSGFGFLRWMRALLPESAVGITSGSAAQAEADDAWPDVDESRVSSESLASDVRPRRIQAPVVWRPAGRPPFATGCNDAGIERVAAYSDKHIAEGVWVEIEVFPRDGSSAAFTASVLRTTKLPRQFPARFDIVFEIKHLDSEAAANLATVLV
jgi:hypothetical protein